MFAQTFTYAWQVAIKMAQAPNGELRIVLKISTTADDRLAGEFHSIDQNGPAVPTTILTASGPAIKMTLDRINTSYEGKLSPDGKTVSGAFNQGAPVHLDFIRATAEIAWTIPEPPPPPKAMDPRADPSFEVATIKNFDPTDPAGVSEGIRTAFHSKYDVRGSGDVRIHGASETTCRASCMG